MKEKKKKKNLEKKQCEKFWLCDELGIDMGRAGGARETRYKVDYTGARGLLRSVCGAV